MFKTPYALQKTKTSSLRAREIIPSFLYRIVIDTGKGWKKLHSHESQPYFSITFMDQIHTRIWKAPRADRCTTSVVPTGL